MSRSAYVYRVQTLTTARPLTAIITAIPLEGTDGRVRASARLESGAVAVRTRRLRRGVVETHGWVRLNPREKSLVKILSKYNVVTVVFLHQFPGFFLACDAVKPELEASVRGLSIHSESLNYIVQLVG
jgi:hypothetical protein